MPATLATPDLTPEEKTAAEALLNRVRRTAWTVIAMLATFCAPFLAVIAFVATYPPFWNPKLAASVTGAGIVTAAVMLLLVALAWRPVMTLQADLRQGKAEDREGTVASVVRQSHVVRITLDDRPQEVLRLEAPAMGDDRRFDLQVGSRVRLRLLPASRRLISLSPAAS